MAHTVVWKYVDSDGETHVLMGHPGAYGKGEEDAMDQARTMREHLGEVNLEPLCIMETDADIDEDIYQCDEIYLGAEDDDELFYNVSTMGRWANQKWWPL